MKRSFDLIVSFLLIVILSPIFALIALVLLIENDGPVFFVQSRLGLNGAVFRLLKFRSMVPGAENQGTGLFSFSDDNRVTKFGAFLRRYSLDEIPQLFNVLQGTLSIVGPRPPVTYELGPWENYPQELRKRFEVKPGITGLAQISGRNNNNWDAKVFFDNQYILLYKRFGILVDIFILLKTAYVVFRAKDIVEVASEIPNGPISKLAYDAEQQRARD